MTGRQYIRFIAKEDRVVVLLLQGSHLEVFFLPPRGLDQIHPKVIPNQVSDDLLRFQGKGKLRQQGVLLDHHPIAPVQSLCIQIGVSPRDRFRIERSIASLPISGEPALNLRIADTRGHRQRLGAGLPVRSGHHPFAQLGERLRIESATEPPLSHSRAPTSQR